MNNQFAPRSCDGVSPLKKVAAIHDLSCFGRCALTVIMPALSAMGYQVIPVPTCLLSSHTGGFENMYFEDLSHAIDKISDHFDRLNIKFDAIYTGFLGSHGQIDQVEEFVKRFGGKDTVILVDPVMGDDGKLYSTYNDELMRGMSRLCRDASIITPNLTEACFLTGTEYEDTSNMSEQELEDFAHLLCARLRDTGARSCVITGLYLGDDRLMVCGETYADSSFFSYVTPRVRKDFPGTGDLFACVLLGAYLDGRSLKQAARRAADFTWKVMEYSSQFDTPSREGVAFEAFLGELSQK